MNGKDVTLLEDTFKKFYFEHFDLLHVPDNPNQREFGYQKFNGGMNTLIRRFSLAEAPRAEKFLEKDLMNHQDATKATLSLQILQE